MNSNNHRPCRAGRLLLTAATLSSVSFAYIQSALAEDQVPTPWNGMEIGDQTASGSSKSNQESVELTDSGGNLSGRSDRFHFVYQSLTGDCAFTARVVADTDQSAIAGLMVRDALATTSNFVALAQEPELGALEIDRTNCQPDAAITPVGQAALNWLRLVKRGITIQTFTAPDQNGKPGHWTLVGKNQPIASGMIYVGMFLSGHGDSSVSTASFDHVSLDLGTQPLLDDGRYTISPADAQSMILTASGIAVKLAVPANDPAQAWTLTKNSDGFYSIRPAQDTSVALTVPDARSDSGTKVSMTHDTGSKSQRWSIIANENDTYCLVPQFNAGIGLDDYGGVGTSDATIDVWGLNTTDPHLQWTFTQTH